MKPILYESTETLFQSNGLGILNDCITCHVIEERNGQYECEFEYPINGVHYSDITEGRIILVSHDESGDLQPFDIYGHSKAINGVTKFYAHHISYRQNAITVKPFTATSLANTLTKIKTNSINTNPFNYSTDKTVATAFQLTEPKPLKSILGGEEGSLLDVYGTGEYEWDRFQVILHLHRGTDSGVVVRYGKNLTELQDDIDYSDSYNGIVPFWFGQNEPADGEEAVDTLVTLSEWVLYKSGSTYDGRNSVIPVDFSSDFERPPTEAELRTAATSYLDRGNPLLPTDTLTFDFVELSDTDEYSYLDLQQVNLCDTVRVVFDDIDSTMKVISVDWNVLSERYDSLTLGDAPTTYAEAITDRLAEIAQSANAGAKLAKLWATNALSIAGNTNQYFWFAGTGTDTGAHITEIPREEFLADPSNGGGNLLARSNGIAARNGLTELATFGANGSQIGISTDKHLEITSNGIDILDNGTSLAKFGETYGGLPSARIGITSDKYVRVRSDGINLVDGSQSPASSMAFFAPTSARIGSTDGEHILLSSSGVDIRDEDGSLSWFGSYARIGRSTEGNLMLSGKSIVLSGSGDDYMLTVDGDTNTARFGSTSEAYIRTKGEDITFMSGDYSNNIPLRTISHDTQSSQSVTTHQTFSGLDLQGIKNFYIHGLSLFISSYAQSLTSVSATVKYNGTTKTQGSISSATLSNGKVTIAAGESVFNISTPDGYGYAIYFDITYVRTVSGNATAVAMANDNFKVSWGGNLTAQGSIKATNGWDGSLYVNGNAVVNNASGYNSYNANGNLRTLSFISSSDNYYFGDGSYTNSEGASYFRGNAVNIQSNGAVNITAPNGVTNSGVYSELFKIAEATATVSSGSSGTAVSSANYTITGIPTGYTPVGIVGITTTSNNVFAQNWHLYSATQVRSSFVRVYATSSDTTVTFKVLCLKATSA